MLRTHLTTHWGLKYPILGAPMAGAAYGRLARAVTAGGGLGFIGIGSTAKVEMIAKEASVARGDDGARFGLGLMVWAVNQRPELLDAAIAQRPFVLSISFGDPAPYVDRIRRAGIVVLSQINTREQARRALDAGVDVIVAQGTESGGHSGHVATLPILQIVLELVAGRVPVLAAGGIATARGLAAVLAAGADGALIGTPLLVSEESDVADDARRRILAATEHDTVLTRVYDVAQRLAWPREHPGRALRNEFTDRWTGREDELPADPAAIAAYEQAAARKDFSVAQIYAGQAVGLLNRPRKAADVAREIGEGAETLLRARAGELLR